MSDDTQVLEFALYTWRRRRLIALTCVTAALLTGIVSFVLPRRYTATASVLINPPNGSDPRTAIAWSQVYLDSLKTYEQIASGDTLFLGAMDDLHLRAPYGDASVEMLKRRILSVSRPVNATYIQIAATLPNAGDAQKLAQHIAERAVELNNSLDDQTNIAEAEAPKKILEAATARRDRLESEATQLAKRGSLEALQKEYASSAEIRTEVGRDLALARANLANYMGELQAPAPVSPAGMTPSEAVNPKGNGNDVVESQSGWLQFQISAAKFRVRDLEEQERKLLGYLNEKSSALEGLQRERESLEAELKSARTDEEGARSRLSEIEVSAPFRGVRLKILDPGIVPQRPSFPNIPLNITVAFVGSIFMALGYLAVQFALERVRHKQESWRMMLQK